MRFYLLRLRNASLREILYRAKEASFVWRMERQLKGGINPVLVPAIDPSDVGGLEMPHFSFESNEDAVERILEGEVFGLNTQSDVLKDFEERHQQVFFARIKLSNAPPDIRAVWEPGRLQHLATLLAYLADGAQATGRANVCQFVREALVGWIGKNPFLLGPHYMSAMECGLRVPVFFYGLKCLDLTGQERRRILETSICTGGGYQDACRSIPPLEIIPLQSVWGFCLPGPFTGRRTRAGNGWQGEWICSGVNATIRSSTTAAPLSSLSATTGLC